MALPSAFQSPTDWFAEHTQRNHRNTPHGQKRHLDDDADAPPTISNGFKRLRISPPRRARQAEQNQPANVEFQYAHQRSSSPTSAYQAPAVTADHNLTETPMYHEPAPRALHHPQPVRNRNQLLPDANTSDTPPPQRLPSNHEDFMPVEDSRHRIFISDLDAAIAEIEAEERAAKEKEQERAFFLPDDVNKEMSSVPEQVLRSSANASANPATSQALVLYKDPFSISVPLENDAVHKAVYEARRRIRDRNNSHPSQGDPVEMEPTPAMDGSTFGYPLDRQQSEWRHNSDASLSSDYDPDAMDIE